MSNNPKVKLFKNSDNAPTIEYWIDVDVNHLPDYDVTSSGPIPQTTNSDGHFAIPVNVVEAASGNQVLTVDLGTLGIDPEEGTIDVELFDGPTKIGNEVVAAESAEESSRPIGSIMLD